MSDLVAWVKEQMRKGGPLKELIKTHTGLAPPAFFAVVALAAAGTALTVSAVSSLFVPPKKSDKMLDAIIEEEIMPYTPSNQRECDVVPVVTETPVVKEAKEEEEEAPVNDVEAPAEDVEAPAKEEKAPAKEEKAPAKEEEAVKPAAPAAPAAADAEDNISSDYVEFEEAVI